MSPRTEGARAAAEKAAGRARSAWRCGEPREGRKPLPGHLRALGEAFWRVVSPGTPCEGCPFEGVYHPDGSWTREVFDGMSLTSTGDGGVGLTWPEALGREITAADREAILAVQRARASMTRMERAEREASE